MNDAPRIQRGGTVGLVGRVYIQRNEDQEVLNLLLDGEYVNVVAPRQMGKSSLVVRTYAELKNRGFAAALIDLQGLGTQPDAESYYREIAKQIARDLKLDGGIEDWWPMDGTAPGLKFRQFLTERVLSIAAERIVLFIDEIDTTLKFAYTDDLFLTFRWIYNERARDPALARLAICLIGVAMPNELVKDRRSTPYNIGCTIFMRDFDGARDDLSQFLDHLGGGKEVLARILHWTGGQPFLMAQLVGELGAARVSTAAEVDAYVEEKFATLESVRGLAHFEQMLRFVEARLTQGLESITLYGRVLAGERLKAQTTAAHVELELSGLVKRDAEGCLVLRNPMYARLFDQEWLRQQRSHERQKVAGSYRQWLRVAAVLLGLLLIPAALYGWQQYQDYGFRTAVAALAKDGYEVTRLSSGLLRLEVKEGASEMSLGLVSNAGIDLEELGEAMLCASYASPCSLTDPERIAHMTNVSDLDLRSTGLVSSEPLRRLTKLQSLNLSGNELTSVEPLQTLVALRKLDLSSNQLTSIEPLRNLKALQELNLSFNELTSVEALEDLISLQSLQLGFNQVDSIEPIRKLTKLTTLDLSSLSLESIEPLQGLTALQSLRLDSDQITSIEPLRYLVELQDLSLFGYEARSIEPLRDLKKLRSLVLYINDLISIEPLADLPALQTLGLAGDGLKSIEPLRNLRSVQDLILYLPNVQDYSPLLDMPALRTLRFFPSKDLPSDIAAALKERGVTVSTLGGK